MKKIFLVIALVLLFLPAVSAKEGSMSLLAVRESTNEGSAANLYLQVRSGSGRVFIETVPLTKFDTQISTRFAKDIACDYINKDCSKYDFFYAINAESPIIGGPSAGAAIAILTIAVLEGIDIDEDVSITGTINSGGIIGPVGGLTSKIEAASSINIKTVIIPKGERFVNDINLTLDLADYARSYNVAIVEAGDLTEALYYFTGKRFKKEVPELEQNEDYISTMIFLAEELCNRTLKLEKELLGFEIDNVNVVDNEFIKTKDKADEFKEDGVSAFEEKMYYSSASYCFGANTRYNSLLLDLKKFKDFDSVEEEINEFDAKLESVTIETITDLEAYMIVKERLKDARDSIGKAKELFEKGKDYSLELGYAIERIYSAESWSKFFEVDGKRFKFDEETLRQSCLNKLSEAEERYHYAKLYFPNTLETTKEELDYAYEDYENQDFELCLFKASKAKAEADVVLGVIGVGEEHVDFVLENKLEAVERVIARQQENDIFPILGYSYYEYANHLKEDNKFGALLYAEYALELSNIDMYFKNKKRSSILDEIDINQLMLLLGGAVLGVMAVYLIKKRRIRKKRHLSSRKKY